MGRLTLLELLKARFPGKSEKDLRAAIAGGKVLADGEKAQKPGAVVREDAELTVRSAPRFVSRGGEKLSHALRLWAWDVREKVFLDAGCSTGGFTDCLLQAGSSLVYSVDVGYNVLDWRLRRNPRVVTLERTNVMALTREALSPPPDAAVADLSFRSLRGAAAHILALSRERRGIFLVKPQFEWRDPPPDFRGVVSAAGDLRGILLRLAEDLALDGVSVRRVCESPIRGRRGNREFLFHLESGSPASADEARGLLEELLAE
jgi:23S rRNA (cytidine1920-2'-O)/16S rRNA (cytidine1409-2'-O)-methyltransferase